MRIVQTLTIVVLFVCGNAGVAGAQLRATVYASGFSSPVGFVQDPTDRTVQFVVEQGGRVRVLRNGVVLPTDFLNISSQVTGGAEQGLLGLAFAPDYATSGRFYVHFTNDIGDSVVARFKRSADPMVADPSSRFDLHWGGGGGPTFIVHPFRYGNHNGGNLVFGPDGYLYIGLGDGGSGGDPNNHAQNPAQFLGKMLRIDVNVLDANPAGYQVPADNPFVSSGPAGTLPEIWDFGLRNPWRYTFDDPAFGGTGALIIGDVGQNLYEEINYEPANHGGRNYGWRIREGMHDYLPMTPAAFLPLTEPIFEYPHPVLMPPPGSPSGYSVTGGYVYRGHSLEPTNRSRYFFADLAGRIWSVALMINSMTGEATASDPVEHTNELGGGAMIGYISAFGRDADGELYTLNYYEGRVIKFLGRTDITGPARSQPLPGPLARFSWTLNPGISQIWLDIGTTVGGSDIYAATQGLMTMRDVSGLPTNGSRVYVRLWSLTAAGWSYTDYAYTAALIVPAGITTPAPSTMLGGTSVMFNWTSGMGVSQIWLDVGTSPGGSQIYAASQGTALSHTVTGLPSNGSTVYLRLWSLTALGWGFTDYTYTAFMTTPAGITSPAPGATFGGSSVTFNWTSGMGVSQIWLDVGTTMGGSQIYGATQGSGVSRTVTGVPINNSPIYVRLWSLTDLGWSFTDYTYTAAYPIPAGILSPAPGSMLTGSTAMFTWTSGRGVSQIWLDVGTTMGGSQIYGATQGVALSRTLTGLPMNGSTIYVRLWSLTSLGWGFTDYVYMAAMP